MRASDAPEFFEGGLEACGGTRGASIGIWLIVVDTRTFVVGKGDDSSLETGVVRSGGDGGQPTAEPGSALVPNDSARGRVANGTWRRMTRRRRRAFADEHEEKPTTLVLPFDSWRRIRIVRI